jgi:hypothetical protein
MITYLKGKLVHKDPTHVVIKIGIDSDPFVIDEISTFLNNYLGTNDFRTLH